MTTGTNGSDMCRKCGNQLTAGAKWCPSCKTPVRIIPDTDKDRPTLFGLRPELILADRFRLLRRIGSGGMGDVWLAYDNELEEQVACKVLKAELAGDTRGIADLKKEVSLTRRLRHPNTVAVYDLHQGNGIYFLTMEYVEGCSLSDALARRGKPYSLEEVLPWVEQLAAALDHAHGHNVLHRDVKPGNIVLATDGTVKLADFGIARIAKDSHTRVTGRETSGTLVYISPEQLMGEHCDGRADLYSLAASIYELLSGKPPFHTGAIPEQIRLKAPSPIPGQPEYANNALLKGLAKKPEGRQANCAELFQQLKGGEPPQAPVKVERSKRSKKLSIGIVAVAVLVMLGIAYGFMRRSGTSLSVSSPPAQVASIPSRAPVPIAVAAPAPPQARGDTEGLAEEKAEKAAKATGSGAGEVRTFSGIEMVWIPPGEFMMGSPESEEGRESNEGPQHRVRIAQGFWLGRTEVTQGQWEAVMGSNPSYFKGDKNLPVERVSWDDCREFIRKLNAVGEGGFRLPTDAEWEYACRAGTTTPFSFGETISTDQANYDGTQTYGSGSKGVYREKTVAVATLGKNQWNLFDMHGNVWEWCQDWCYDSYDGAPTDGSAWESPKGVLWVLRGGSWNSDPGHGRSANRSDDTPDHRDYDVGFRLLRTP